MSHRPPFPSGMLLLLLSVPATAQFAQLSATDDGKQLYFTSQLQLQDVTSASVSPFPEARLYSWGSNGVTLFAERGALASPHVGGSSSGVQFPQATGDGSLVGFTFVDVCPTDPQCTTSISEGEIRGLQTLDLGQGSVQLSHNGRWALLTKTVYPNTPGVPLVPTITSTLIDLATGEHTGVPNAPGFGTPVHTLASDGTLVVQPDSQPLSLWKRGQLSPIPLPSDAMIAPTQAWLSDDGSTLVTPGFSKQAAPPVGIGIFALDLASGRLTVLVPSTDPVHIPFLIGVSRDGQTVLYHSSQPNSPAGPAYVVSRGQSIPIQLPDGEFVSDGTLTGGGDVAFLATTRGRIVKVAVASGALETVVPNTPYCSAPFPAGVPGSRLHLACTVAGSTSELQGNILFDGIPAPVLAAQAGEIDVQVPWEVTPKLGRSELSFRGTYSSPFAASQPINMATALPAILGAPAGQKSLFGLALVKGDWSGLVDAQPGPGGLFYAYMTGLGPVRDPVATGAPAPLDTPDPILGELKCRFLPQSQDFETVFAGLAPGYLGIYQVAFRMPADAGAAPINGYRCTLGGASLTVIIVGG